MAVWGGGTSGEEAGAASEAAVGPGAAGAALAAEEDGPAAAVASGAAALRDAGSKQGTMQTKQFLQALDDARIVAAIEQAERRTSGEIRVFISERAVEDVLEEAGRQFERLGMSRTQSRNGVLLYLAPVSQTFAIRGDEAIHEKCGQSFWEQISAKMTDHLKGGRWTEAIVAGVEQAGEAMALHFPRQADDRNELPNRIERDGGPANP